MIDIAELNKTAKESAQLYKSKKERLDAIRPYLFFISNGTVTSVVAPDRYTMTLDTFAVINGLQSISTKVVEVENLSPLLTQPLEVKDYAPIFAEKRNGPYYIIQRGEL